MGFFDDAIAAGRGAVESAQKSVAKAGGLHLGFVAEFAEMAQRGAEAGWHEAHGGNASLWLNEAQRQEAAPFLAPEPGEWVMLEQPVPAMAGELVLTTAAGCRMDQVKSGGALTAASANAATLGIVELDISGSAWRRVFGFEGGNRPTSELNGHLVVLEARGRATDGASRVVYHAHPSAAIAMGKLVGKTDVAVTNGFWRAMTEAVMAVPEGVGYVGPLVPGSLDLARASASVAASFSCMLWASHGLLCTGATCDEALQKMEVLAKAADVWMQCRWAGMTGEEWRASVPDAVLEGICAQLGLALNRNLLGE